MLRALLATAAALLLAFPPVAPAVAARERLPQRPPSPPHARVVAAPCPPAITAKMAAPADAVVGCAVLDPQDPLYGTAFVGARADVLVREHELGHFYDAQVLDDGARSKLTRLLGFPAGTPWQAPEADDGLAEPAERFADAYRMCRLRMLPGRGGREVRAGRDASVAWWSPYGYEPRSNTVHRQVCGVITRAGHRIGL